MPDSLALLVTMVTCITCEKEIDFNPINETGFNTPVSTVPSTEPC